ncbi:MAG: IS4/IS5 family transposase, partial [Planctomycetaceae bacterium]
MANDTQPEHVNFTATMQCLANTWLASALAALECSNSRDHLVTLRLTHGHSHRVGNRPNRIEP